MGILYAQNSKYATSKVLVLSNFIIILSSFLHLSIPFLRESGYDTGGGERMNVVSWLLFGLVAGIVAHFIDPRPATGGLIGAVTLGLVGAVLGGLTGSVVFDLGTAGFNIGSLFVAVLGSLLILFIGRALRSR